MFLPIFKKHVHIDIISSNTNIHTNSNINTNANMNIRNNVPPDINAHILITCSQDLCHVKKHCANMNTSITTT